jgi:ribonuclease E
MDRVGVSRKVEDEEQRREMRRILDSLELPEGCGFILRTAGFDRTKSELQRDALYLQRLWEAMERRMKSTGAPCTLYTESDLLVRTIRDVVDDSVEAIVVDSESAFQRAKTFIQVVAPLNSPRLCYYDKQAPIFYAFSVEQQIEQIHNHKVPLPSGGALVIDQTEAMVTIDVNSGKSRSARDSETNAFNTNKEAVDEISRQLRLRDLGGIIVNDLIDMRSSRHRREIEERLQEALRRDRAKTTTLDISDFGIIEMTRQRMRPGLHKTNYMDCPHCHGLGEVRVPDAVAADCMRKAALLFCYERVHRVEVVCSVRVASVLLSSRRGALYELEERAGKRVDIRISETFGIDRVDIYAYDDRGADIETDRLQRVPTPRIADLLLELPAADEGDDDDGGDDAEYGRGRGRRRRRRKPQPADATAMALAGNFDDLPTPTANEPSLSELIRRSDAERQARKAADLAAKAQDAVARIAAGESGSPVADAGLPSNGGDAESPDGGRKRRRRRGRGRGRGDSVAAVPPSAGSSEDSLPGSGAADSQVTPAEGSEGAVDGGPKRRRRRRRGRGGRGSDDRPSISEGDAPEGSAPAGADMRETPRTDVEGAPADGNGESRDGPREGGRSRGSRRGRRGGRGRGRSGGANHTEGGSDGAPATGNHPPQSFAPPPSASPPTHGEPKQSAPESAAKKTIRSVTGWMRRLKGPVAGGRDDR